MCPLARRPEPEYMDDAREAEAYAAADFADVNQRFVDRLLELAGPREEAAALDLGTGPGDIPLRVLRACPRWRITAVDASAAMLDLARRTESAAGSSGRIVWLQADAKSLPLGDHAFDVVFSNSILHHLPDAAPFWAEVKRVAKPGALIFLRDLARPASPEDARRIVETYSGQETPLLKEEFYRSLLSAYTVAEVRAQLAAADFGGLEVAMVTDRHLDVWGAM